MRTGIHRHSRIVIILLLARAYAPGRMPHHPTADLPCEYLCVEALPSRNALASSSS